MDHGEGSIRTRAVSSMCFGQYARLVAFIAVLGVAAACQSDVTTPFPPGLEPLEDNPVPKGPPVETLRSQTSSDDLIRIYARGYILASPATVWLAAQNPMAVISTCSTDQQRVTINNKPEYDFDFTVHYTVTKIITIEWDDQWRYGIIDGSPAAPVRGMIRHQKTQGSDFITRSLGTIQILATSDPTVTELEFVEHLDAVGGTAADVLRSEQHVYDALLALSHGQPIPGCPP